MRKINMVDLGAQYQNIKSDIDRAIQEVTDSCAFINGQPVKDLCRGLEDYTGAKHVLPCANGTDALQIALMALDCQPGDEVITVPFTFVATAEVIALLGLKPVFVDIEPDSFNIDVAQIESLITEKTKVIIPVHLFGQSCDMEPLLALTKKHGIAVVEDNAQSIGAEYQFSNGTKQKTGTMGDIGTLSFYPTKNLGAYGDGGALFTNSDALAEKMRLICNHGSDRKYYYDAIGVNSRLDSYQAAILDIKLKKLDSYNADRQRAAAHYDAAFANHEMLSLPVRSPFSTHVFHQYTLRAKRRDALQAHLGTLDVPSMIYYPVSLHLSSAYMKFGYSEGQFPVSELASQEVISLPMHSELDDEQLTFISNSVLKFYN